MRLTIAWTPSQELAQMCLSDQHKVKVGLAAWESICLNCSSEAGNDAGNIKRAAGICSHVEKRFYIIPNNCPDDITLFASQGKPWNTHTSCSAAFALISEGGGGGRRILTAAEDDFVAGAAVRQRATGNNSRLLF